MNNLVYLSKTLNSPFCNACVALVLTVGMSVGCCPIVKAQTTTLALPQRRARPQIPANFDRDTVANLLNAIDQDQNATILKIGYFFRRGQPTFPVEDGYELLKTALAKEPIGSKRWFVLQEVRGWAGLRCPQVTLDESFEAYSAIFDHAESAKQVKAVYTLDEAIRLYVSAVQGRLVEMGLLEDERIRSTLFKAWTAYTIELKGSRLQGLGPSWREAIEKTTLQVEFAKLIDDVLKEGSIPKTYDLLMLAASVWTRVQPARAVKLLEQARPLLPHNGVGEAERFYGALVTLLIRGAESKVQDDMEDGEQMEKAITYQRERVQFTGTGQAMLLNLLARNGQQEGVEEVLRLLSAPDAPEREINGAVDKMQELYAVDDVKFRFLESKPSILLNNYLSLKRKRNLEQELRARKNLAEIYIATGEISKAKNLLAIDKLDLSQLTLAERQYSSQISRMLESLNSPATKELP